MTLTYGTTSVDVYGSAPVVGCRIFTLDQKTLTLKSLNGTRNFWIPGEIKASKCSRVHPKVADAHGILEMPPAKECTCGIWSCKTRRMLERTYNPRLFCEVPDDRMGFYYPPVLYIYARVEQWGIVIEHETGYRSQYARIVPDSINIYPRYHRTPRNRRLTSFLREKYSTGGGLK